MPFSFRMIFKALAVLALVAIPLSAWGDGCYDERIGDTFSVDLGGELCMKNTKWNCKPLCFYYAGMTDNDTFSLGVARHQGALNIYHPYNPDEKSIFSVAGNNFEILEITPEKLKVKYLGE